MKLPSFNIVRPALCTCLPKYNLNTYLGRCEHRCIYCYAVKFPSFRGPTVPRLSLKDDITKMVENTKVRLPVMLSDATDPYQPMERKYEVTRRCLEALAERGFPLLIVTKSDLVTRDVDLFKRTRTVVSMTISTPRREIAEMIEPYAPPPQRRFSALKVISDEGIPTVVRIDPLIPSVNTDDDDVEAIIARSADIGVKQVTASTLKPVTGFFSALRSVNPELQNKLVRAYKDGAWISGYKYLDKRTRLRLIKKVRRKALKYGLAFASCREGLQMLNTSICDGSAYCREWLERFMK
jgi:DNA repair photolyase